MRGGYLTGDHAWMSGLKWQGVPIQSATINAYLYKKKLFA